jgi:hypothetical protein
MKNTIIALALVASIAAASGQTKPAAKKARAEKECQTVKGSCCKKMDQSGKVWTKHKFSSAGT